MDEDGRRFVNQLQADSGTAPDSHEHASEGHLSSYDMAQNLMDWVDEDEDGPAEDLRQVQHDLRDLRLSMYDRDLPCFNDYCA